MEILTTESTIVNFLRVDQKIIDWRFVTSEQLRNKGFPAHETIYWLGIIEVENITADKLKQCPIHFVDKHFNPREDREYTRTVDGAHNGITAVLYDLTSIAEILKTAKEMGSTYVHVLVEEQVSTNGILTANIFVSKGKTGTDMLSGAGFQSVEPWINLKSFYTVHLSHVDISELIRVRIRTTSEYKWQK